MFGDVVRGVPGVRFEDEIARIKDERGVTLDTELDADALRELTRRFQALYDFPADPREQLQQAIEAVFDSWMGDRAVAYRRINGIPDDWGTAVNVQQMVYGNQGPTSASGVAFSRDEVTGAPGAERRLPASTRRARTSSPACARRATCPSSRDWMPEAHARLVEILRTLERHYGDMQDTEFTVEEGRLYMLQTRSAKRPAQAAVRFAVDAVEEGLLTRARGDRDDRRRLAQGAAAPDLRSRTRTTRSWPRGVAASPGAAKGAIVFTAPDAVAAAEAERDVILVPAVHRGRRRRRLPRGQGHPHLRGRQGLARGARRPRHGPARGHRRRRARHRPARGRGAHRRAGAARGRPDRDRRDDRRHHARRRAARDPRGRPALRDRARLVRRAAHARRARERRHARGRAPGARVRRRGHRPLPDRAHVHGGGPPAEDAAR